MSAELPTPRWSVREAPDPAAARILATELAISLPLAQLLLLRGLADSAEARSFLRPTLDMLSDPMRLADMDRAVAAITKAASGGTPIMVHGDYDVDGQCATALLTTVLREAGARVVPMVPHRLRHGYDFGPAAVERARKEGVGLVVTCDCGISAGATVREAAAAGIDVIVTDHHLPGPDLPPALAVIDPSRPDDASGLEYLCGTGIAFKLAQALVGPLGLPETLPFHFLDYVALATVADIVPLVGENRVMVRHGLKLLQQSRWPGLRALVDSCDLKGKEVRAGHLGFMLGPRLNAVGRIGDANDGVALLLSDDPVEAAAMAERLNELNRERQAIDQRILDEALTQVERDMVPERDYALVLAGEGWHPGVVGIVASRVVERYGRPTFLVAFDGQTGKGSGRSISRFDLHEALTHCADLLVKFGGHTMAAGLTIERDQLPEFRERLAAWARGKLDSSDLGPEQRVDLVIELADATPELENLCRHLEPCGQGNPSPVLGVRNVTIDQRQIVGSGHLKGVISDGESSLPMIGFQWADRVPWLSDAPVDVAFKLERNDWGGHRRLQARLLALSPAGSEGVVSSTPAVAASLRSN